MYDSGVHRRRPEQLDADGEGHVGDGGGQAVDDGQGVQPFQQHAPPLGRHGTPAQQFVQAGPLDRRQPAQPVGGEIVAAGGRQQGRSVGDGRRHPPFRELRFIPAYTAPLDQPERAARSSRSAKGSLRQPAQQAGLAMGQGHSATSPPAAGSSPSSPVGLRLLRCRFAARSGVRFRLVAARAGCRSAFPPAAGGSR